MTFGMKETAHSLQLYFGLIGALGFVRVFLAVESIYVKASNPSAVLGNPIVLAGLVIAALFACAYLYVAITLRDLLIVRPNIVRGVVITSMVFVGLSFAASILRQPTASQLVWFAIEIFIPVYLLVNINRLVREQNE